MRNLSQIAQAVQAYISDSRGEFPNSFSDLLGSYISDPTVFHCPSAARQGRLGSPFPDFIDPAKVDAIAKGYIWELTPLVLDYQGEGPSLKKKPLTFRDIKLLQMKTAAGPHVPIVRCFHHSVQSDDHRCLNLTASGEIYESGLFWEAEWVDLIARSYLSPSGVARFTEPVSELLRDRPEAADPTMIDLRPWVNARLEDPWFFGRHGEELASFNQSLVGGVFTHEGTRFDAAGIIQLNGRAALGKGERGFETPHFPSRRDGVTIDRACSRLHFLGGLLFSSANGTAVAELRFHFLDEKTGATNQESVTWRYGVDIANIGFPEGGDPGLPSPNTSIAWTGDSPLGKQAGITARIFHLVVENPRPGKHVSRIDFLGGMEPSAPFILAITVEP